MSNTPDMNNSEPPPIPESLVKWLEQMFPPKDFTKDMTLREMDRYGGTRDLVVILRNRHTQQNQPETSQYYGKS